MALRRGGLLWAYLLLIMLAELVTSLLSAQLGQLIHVVLLVVFLFHGAIGPRGTTRRLVLALSLAPLIRVLSLSMPLTRFPQLDWYPIVAIPLFVAGWLIIRRLELTREELGLRWGNLALQLGMGGFGVMLGVIEYYILSPRPQFVEPTWQTFTLAALNLVIFTGFCEELIFRGILQSVAGRALGRWALLYVSLVFSVLHIGYFSILDVLFVTGVGLLFAYIARWSGSILGVTLAHGINNVMLFLVMPQLPELTDLRGASWTPWAIAIASSVTMIALLSVYLTLRNMPPISTELKPGERIRELRRAAGMSYVELAERSGIPARVLGEIEHGRRAPQPSELRLIAASLKSEM